MDNKTPAGLLTGPNLISCIGELSLQDFDDMTHCTQIATRSADMICSRFTDSTQWLDEYVKTLNFLGWWIFEDSISTRIRHDVSNSVADFLVQSAQAMPDSRQGNAMIDTLDALKPDKPALYSLDTESLMGKRFQVMPARGELCKKKRFSVLRLGGAGFKNHSTTGLPETGQKQTRR